MDQSLALLAKTCDPAEESPLARRGFEKGACVFVGTYLPFALPLESTHRVNSSRFRKYYNKTLPGSAGKNHLPALAVSQSVWEIGFFFEQFTKLNARN